MGQKSSHTQQSQNGNEEQKNEDALSDNIGLLALEELQGKSPIVIFQQWYGEAFRVGAVQPFAMSLSTCGSDCRPSNRMVVLGNVDEKGFYFGTRKGSRKAVQIKENPHAAATFYWPKLNRSVRIEGCVQLSDDRTPYNIWPEYVKIGFHASSEIGEVASDAELAEAHLSTVKKFAEVDEVPFPEHYQAYCIAPFVVEFMHERLDGPNDRYRFTKVTENGVEKDESEWACVKLYP